jgi:hypothetical protein
VAPIASNAQVSEAPGVAGGLDAVGEEEQQAVRALQVLEHVRERVLLLDVGRLGQQVDDDLGVGRRLKDVAVFLVLVAQELRVDEVAVVGNGDRAH